MKHILIAYEERPVSDRVLERAAEVAKAFGARVTVTSVAPLMVGTTGRGVGPYDPADPPARHEQETTDAVERLAKLGVSDAEAAPLVGDATDAIVDLARERKSDLLVIGAHEGGLLSRLTHGSIEDSLIHKAPTDVLVVR